VAQHQHKLVWTIRQFPLNSSLNILHQDTVIVTTQGTSAIPYDSDLQPFRFPNVILIVNFHIGRSNSSNLSFTEPKSLSTLVQSYLWNGIRDAAKVDQGKKEGVVGQGQG